ncbi:MAG: hypothetical protein SOX46_02580 [Clostridiaceae bacterium]|nr:MULTISPECIES: hypothetical protein [Clostridium]MCI6138801.1 hypothetical protein [Clostridium sp.]MDY3230448.1 hypothetical protein [Clostridiaceae bacterium]
MENSSRTNEAAAIFRQLSPENQVYLIALARMAEVAERNAKKKSTDNGGK